MRTRKWSIAPLIVNIGNGWRWVVRFTSGSLCLWGTNRLCPFNRRLSPSGRAGGEANVLPLPRNEPWCFGRPVHNLITLSIELPKLEMKCIGRIGEVFCTTKASLNWSRSSAQIRYEIQLWYLRVSWSVYPWKGIASNFRRQSYCSLLKQVRLIWC